jgi:hypothetical protein
MFIGLVVSGNLSMRAAAAIFGVVDLLESVQLDRDALHPCYGMRSAAYRTAARFQTDVEVEHG